MALRVTLVGVIAITIACWVLLHWSQKEPEFYQQALAVSERAELELGDEFENQVLELQNNARTKGAWQATFTEAQINGWLASGLTEKFPRAIPHNVSDPRVGIDLDLLRVAFRFQSSRLSCIVQAEMDAFCTEVPDQIAIRIKKVASGLVPIPVNSVADRISTALRQFGAQVSWTEIEGDPVALIEFPLDTVKLGEKIITIEAIQLIQDKLVLTGNSVSVDKR